MIKKLILPLLLSFGMVSALAMNPVTVHAEEDSGIVTSKTVDYDETDGSYTITLEAYATGEATTSTITKDVPTDIILVLDLSSSMTQTMNTVSYTEYSGKTNEELYALRYNGGEKNLWYRIPGTTKYASVSVTTEGREPIYTDAGYNNNNSELWDKSNNLYAKIDGEYVKVTVSRDRAGRNYTYTYTYTYDGETKTVTSRRSDGSPNFGSGVSLYFLSEVNSTNATYTYSYTDSTGTKVITTSTGGSEMPDDVFYSQSTAPGTTKRLQALQDACTSFANAVAEKAKASEDKEAVKHRIAVVGFNSSAFLYIGKETSTDYKSAFQDMSTDKGKNNVLASINALGTAMGTNADAGMTLANTIFSENPVPLEGETARNRVVVFFTDGAPGTGGSTYFDKGVADDTITAAGTARDSHGATVYSVAVVDGAEPTKAGVEPQEESGPVTADKINWYLQNVSNNKGTPPADGKPSYYLAADDADSLKDIFSKIAEESSKGGSTSKLNSSAVVKDIMSPYFTLPEGAKESDISVNTYKCKDDTDSPTGFGFEETSSGPRGATARIDEDGNVSVTGFDFSENWCGLERSEAGFQKVREGGYKLVISFKVQPKDGFLGGNNVPTNGEHSGVYENAEADTPVEEFTVPKANVTIKDVTTTAEDKNVYLLGGVTLEQLKRGATVTVGADPEGKGGIKLDLSKATDEDKPYGLEKWQSEYVNITVTIKDKDGTKIPATGLRNLKEDSGYSIEVKIEPEEAAEAESVGPNVEAGTGEDTANINVFKPQLTFKDGNAYYGETAWDDTQYGTNCKTYEGWLHAAADGTSTEDTEVTMLGTKPALTIAYTPDATKLYDDAGTKKFGKADVPVKAETKIDAEDVTKYTTFVHTACPEDSGCTWKDQVEKLGDPAFLIHIKTCKLTVTKAGDDSLDNGSYVFTVRKDGQPYSEVSIQGNDRQTLCELPVGTYSIEENTGWSWRYSEKPNYSANVNLSSTNTEGTITCKNTRVKDKWLDGYSAIVRNVFGIGSSSAAGSDTQ